MSIFTCLMKTGKFTVLLLALISLLFAKCAQVGQLTGGKRDTEPPKVTSCEPANNAIRFAGSGFDLICDEYVQVKDIANQLQISPLLKNTPEVTAEGKTIKVRFKPEDLKPGTTYKFSFGASIADMHEGNAMKGFDYVLSTGTNIDTLKLSGTITDAFTNKPSGGTLVGLYENIQNDDSLPMTRLPDYIATCDDAGNFTFSNLPERTFEVYAIGDKNKNRLYDREEEKVGFIPMPLLLKQDSVIRLSVFQENAARNYIRKSVSPAPGNAFIIYSRKSKVRLKANDPEGRGQILQESQETEKDTIRFFYRGFGDSINVVAFNANSDRSDTLVILAPRKSKSRKRTFAPALNIASGKLELHTKPRLLFQQWMDTTIADLGHVKLSSKKDSMVNKVPLKGRWISAGVFELQIKLRDSTAYRLSIDTLAFRNINGMFADSVTLDFATRSEADFGKLTLKLKVNKKQNYLVQLVSGQTIAAQKEISFSLSSSNATDLVFTEIPPGNYDVKLIYDTNENKKWDSGDLIMKKLPEQVFVSQKQVKVIGDWESEEEITVKE